MKFARLLIITCALLATSLISYKFIFTKNNADNNQLIIGTASGYAPYVSLNAQGEYEGFDIDIAQELARRMKKNLVIKDCGSMVPLMLCLQNGSVDLLIWALEINNTRLKEMEMVQYQGGNVSSYPLVFWNEIPATIKSLEDLATVKNAVVCIEPGSSQEKFLNKFDFIAKKPMEKVVDMLLDIKYGKSLAAMVDPSLIKTLQQKNPEIKVLDIPLDKDSQSFGNGICIKKGNQKLLQQVQQVINAMKADGTIKKLEEKYNL